MSRIHRATSEAQTHALGMALGRAAFPGCVVLLFGDLGAGKTAFTRGVGAGLEVTSRVQSPTYILVQAHSSGRLPLWHADLYRLADEADLEQLGLDELLESEGMVVVEWPERAPGFFPADHLEIRIAIEPDDTRTFTFLGRGPRHEVLEELDV